MDVRKTELLRKTVLGLSVAAGTFVIASETKAQTPAGLTPVGQSRSTELIDPETGDRYRQYTQRYQRPVVDERIERQESLVYRPETVKETRPEYRTSYLPITQMKWMPYVENRWNPFRQPRVAYRQVPETHWEARNEVINRTTMQTRWIPEKRTIEIPHRVVRYETVEQPVVELAARAMPQPRLGPNVSPQIAARLRPISQSNPAGFSSAPTTAIATNNVGRSGRDDSHRDSMQRGMQTNVLQRSSGLGSPLPMPGSNANIATSPSLPIYR